MQFGRTTKSVAGFSRGVLRSVEPGAGADPFDAASTSGCITLCRSKRSTPESSVRVSIFTSLAALDCHMLEIVLFSFLLFAREGYTYVRNWTFDILLPLLPFETAAFLMALSTHTE